MTTSTIEFALWHEENLRRKPTSFIFRAWSTSTRGRIAVAEVVVLHGELACKEKLTTEAQRTLSRTSVRFRDLCGEPFSQSDGNRDGFVGAASGCSGCLPAGAFRNGLGGGLEIGSGGSFNAARR